MFKWDFATALGCITLTQCPGAAWLHRQQQNMHCLTASPAAHMFSRTQARLVPDLHSHHQSVWVQGAELEQQAPKATAHVCKAHLQRRVCPPSQIAAACGGGCRSASLKELLVVPCPALQGAFMLAYACQLPDASSSRRWGGMAQVSETLFSSGDQVVDPNCLVSSSTWPWAMHAQGSHARMMHYWAAHQLYSSGQIGMGN